MSGAGTAHTSIGKECLLMHDIISFPKISKGDLKYRGKWIDGTSEISYSQWMDMVIYLLDLT